MMPELPDINAYLRALDARIVGQTLGGVRVANGFVLRTAEPPLTDAPGHVVRELRRIGKRVAVGLDNDLWLVIHLMVAGRLHWRAPGVKLPGVSIWRHSISRKARWCSPRRVPSVAHRCTSSAENLRCAP